jgi:DNA-binding response OmpR family regulator
VRTKSGARILIIEDDPAVRHVVTRNLAAHGFRTEAAAAGREGLDLDPSFHSDLILLDLGLPDMSGLDVIPEIRARTSTPIIVLSIRGGEADKVRALDLGADDYLTKPFSVRELVARARAIFRRMDFSGHPDETDSSELPSITFRSLSIDQAKRKVEVEGNAVELTAREFELLTHFARHPGRCYTRQELLDAVWGYQYAGYEHTVNSHISRLRAKIEEDPSNPRYIETVWGVGYRLAE